VNGPARAAAFVYASDGRWAAAWDADGPASLWDVEAGKERAVLGIDEPPNVMVLAPRTGRGGEGDHRVGESLHWVAFSPDGRTVALADEKGGVAWCEVREAERTEGLVSGEEAPAPFSGSEWWLALRSCLLGLLTRYSSSK
jgi:hypothetical protein